MFVKTPTIRSYTSTQSGRAHGEHDTKNEQDTKRFKVAKEEQPQNTCEDHISHSRTLSKDTPVQQGDIFVHLELAKGHFCPKGRTFEDIFVQLDVSHGHFCPCLGNHVIFAFFAPQLGNISRTLVIPLDHGVLCI
jgi:hypothetical protein